MRGGGEFAWRGPLDSAGFALLVVDVHPAE